MKMDDRDFITTLIFDNFREFVFCFNRTIKTLDIATFQVTYMKHKEIFQFPSTMINILRLHNWSWITTSIVATK